MLEGLMKDMRTRMDKCIDAFRHELGGLRTGRASADLLAPVMVDAYGSQMPLAQCGSVSVADSRLLVVSVWDKSVVSAVEKAIRDAGLGLNPQVDGQNIRLSLPDLTAERRQELVKLARKYAEQGRVAVRNVRRDGMDELKKLQKDGEISEDDARRASDQVQKITDDFVASVDKVLADKEKDILHV
ncbi:MAG: ribosome recycling factor [Proteobacteria bacterium]|nr:ribosome recycling factor [Pseudomonadota bacterium]